MTFAPREDAPDGYWEFGAGGPVWRLKHREPWDLSEWPARGPMAAVVPQPPPTQVVATLAHGLRELQAARQDIEATDEIDAWPDRLGGALHAVRERARDALPNDEDRAAFDGDFDLLARDQITMLRDTAAARRAQRSRARLDAALDAFAGFAAETADPDAQALARVRAHDAIRGHLADGILDQDEAERLAARFNTDIAERAARAAIDADPAAARALIADPAMFPDLPEERRAALATRAQARMDASARDGEINKVRAAHAETLEHARRAAKFEIDFISRLFDGSASLVELANAEHDGILSEVRATRLRDLYEREHDNRANRSERVQSVHDALNLAKTLDLSDPHDRAAVVAYLRDVVQLDLDPSISEREIDAIIADEAAGNEAVTASSPPNSTGFDDFDQEFEGSSSEKDPDSGADSDPVETRHTDQVRPAPEAFESDSSSQRESSHDGREPLVQMARFVPARPVPGQAPPSKSTPNKPSRVDSADLGREAVKMREKARQVIVGVLTSLGLLPDDRPTAIADRLAEQLEAKLNLLFRRGNETTQKGNRIFARACRAYLVAKDPELLKYVVHGGGSFEDGVGKYQAEKFRQSPNPIPGSTLGGSYADLTWWFRLTPKGDILIEIDANTMDVRKDGTPTKREAGQLEKLKKAAETAARIVIGVRKLRPGDDEDEYYRDMYETCRDMFTKLREVAEQNGYIKPKTK